MLLIVNHAHVSQGQFRRGRRGSDLDDAACVHSASPGVHRAPVDARASEATKMCAYKMYSTTAELVGLFTLFLVFNMWGFLAPFFLFKLTPKKEICMYKDSTTLELTGLFALLLVCKICGAFCTFVSF